MTTSASKFPRLHSIDHVAQTLNVSTKTVRRWVKDRDLHAHQLGRQWRISDEDLALFLVKNRR